MAKPKAKNSISVRTLQDLGLTENEAILYTEMLGREGSTVQELAVRAPFPRTMLYYVLKRLSERSLVSARKEGWRTVYVAESPDKLYELLANREHEFEREAGAVRKLIPELKRAYHLAGARPTVRVFEGVDAYAKALEDIILTAPQEIRAFETIEGKKSALQIREAHESRRIARKIKKRVLFFESRLALSALVQRPYDDYTVFRSLTPGDTAPFDADVVLYDGKVLYSSYQTHEPTAVLVEDRALYMMQASLFDSLWKRGVDQTLAFTKTR